MYQSFFGLHRDPFALGPSLRFLYRSQAHAETMAHLGFGLEQGEDIILIVGAIGTGKTLALHSLQAKVSKLFRQVLVNVTSVSYPEFLKLVLHELEQSWQPGSDTADLLCLLKDKALAVHAEGQKILLIVDEAQNLDSQTLEAIRLLTNLGQPDRQLFQIVLAGQPALEDLIDRPELAQLRQRIRIHYRLEPLTAAETGEYIAHRLRVAGREDPIFTPRALARIHELSRGIPRLVNHLAGHALLAAFVAKDQRVDAHHVAAEGLPEAPPPVVEATPSPAWTAAKPVDRTPPPSPQTDAAPTGTPVRPTPAPVEPPASTPSGRPLTARAQRQESGPPRRLRGWVGVWLLIIALAAMGAWTLLKEDQFDAPGDLQAGRLMPSTGGPGSEAVRDARQDVIVQPGAGEEPTGAGSSPVAGDPTTTIPPEEISGQTRLPASTAQPADRPAALWLHVASFRDFGRAERYMALLAAAGSPVQHRDVQLADGRAWRRVLIGPFPEVAQADSAAVHLENAGLVSYFQVFP
jgi:type II secretory pathway predicted ATPase ExeA